MKSIREDLNHILAALHQQNTQINQTLQHMHQHKSMHNLKGKPHQSDTATCQSPSNHPTNKSNNNNNKTQSKSFHRCQSCQIINNSRSNPMKEHKENQTERKGKELKG